MSAPSPTLISEPAHSRPSCSALQGPVLWSVLLLLVAYAVFLAANFAPVAAGADSGGYYNSARMLTEGRFSTPVRSLPEFPPPTPWMHTPLGFTPDGDLPGLKPTYPVGLPLHYAAASYIGGWHWGVLVLSVAGSVAALWLTYGLLREFEVRTPLALAGAACLALSPQFLYISFLPMSDVVATAWCAAAFLGALKARRAWAWSILSGLAFGVAVLVRPTNIVLGLPLIFFLPNWRALLGVGIGGLAPAAMHVFYSRVMYGSALRTGYGDMTDAFGWEHVGPSWLNYLKSFYFVLPVVVPAIVLLWWLPWRRRWLPLSAALLAVVILVVFYSFYCMTPLVWWYLRFLLPIFPLIILLGLLGMQGWIERMKGANRAEVWWSAALAVTVVSLVTSVHWSRKQHIMLMKPFQQPYVAIGNWAAAHLPENAVVVCMQTSSAQYFYNRLPVVRWDLTPPEVVPQLKAALDRTQRPTYATILSFEREDLMQRFPWGWEKVAQVTDIEVYRTLSSPMPSAAR